VAANRQNFVAQIKAITPGRGVRRVFEPVAGKGVLLLAAASADHGATMIAAYPGGGSRSD
jgi:NADPH:quinone reductase-like Zn-dependent oxidoreductase